MLAEVLLHRDTSWRVGETKAERVARRRDRTLVASDERYPGSFPGQVISVRRVGARSKSRRQARATKLLPSLRNMADKDHLSVVLDISPAQRASLASGRSKIVNDSVAPVTFNNRHGAIAPILRKQFADVEDAETRSEDRDDFEGRRFVEIALLAKQMLAPTVTHTGTTMYWVKETPTLHNDTQSGAPAGQVITLTTGGLGANAFVGGYISNTTRGEIRSIVSHNAGDATLEGSLTNWLAGDTLEVYDSWSTIQAALDQLFTDQGSTTFTASQYSRIFAGTFDENVVPNANLNTGVNGFPLIIEGDSATARASIHLAPTTGTPLAVANDFEIMVRHLKVTRADSGAAMTFTAVVDVLDVKDCDVSSTSVCISHNASRPTRISNCKLAFTSNGGVAVTSANSLEVRECEFIGSGTVNAWAFSSMGGLTVEACTFRALRSIALPFAFAAQYTFTNCSLFNCTYMFELSAFTLSYTAINCIADTVTNVFFQAPTTLPEETATAIGAEIVLRNNNFGTYTDYADIGGVKKTYAQFIALNRVDASEDIDATDPLMTDPASGDFSLQDASVCKWTGHGAGVITGINGVPLDPNHPDRGAWSSGVVPAPSWAADDSNIEATDLAATGEVGLTWDAADDTVLTNLNIGYIVESRTSDTGSGAGAWGEHFRTTTTSGTVGALADDVARDFRVTAYTRIGAAPSDVASDTDTATPTGVDVPEAPEIEATDLLNQSDVRVDIVADDLLDVSTIFYQITPGGVLQTWPNTVTGDGSETLTLTVKPYAIYAVAQRGGCNSVPSNIEFVTVQAANQFTNIRTALWEWVKGVVGNPKVIWRAPNASQPLKPYVAIKMGPTVTIGSDYHGGNDVSGVETVSGDREFVFSVQVYGKPADEDQGEVNSMLERIRSSLEKQSIQATLAAAGLAFRTVEGSADLTGIGGTEWEARAFKDFRFGITYEDTDDVGQISTVETPVGTLE